MLCNEVPNIDLIFQDLRDFNMVMKSSIIGQFKVRYFLLGGANDLQNSRLDFRSHAVGDIGFYIGHTSILL